MRISDILMNEETGNEEDLIKMKKTKKKKKKKVYKNLIVQFRLVKPCFSRWVSSYKGSTKKSSSGFDCSSFIHDSQCMNNGRGDFVVNNDDHQSLLLLDSSATTDTRDVSDDNDYDESTKTNEAASSTSSIEVNRCSAGKCMEDVSFNLGLGAGLAFLMVACKDELNKIMELRSQVEPFIKDFNEKIQREDVSSSNSNNDICFSITNSPVVASTKCNSITQNRMSGHHLVKKETVEECDRNLELSRKKGNSVDGFDELEAEFEVELERLQYILDSEDSLEHSQQQAQEMIDEDSAFITIESSSDLIVNVVNDEHLGVSPHELERKLHELLEERQKERIKELEFDLECAKEKLRQKEIEVSLWKDTATFSHQHI